MRRCRGCHALEAARAVVLRQVLGPDPLPDRPLTPAAAHSALACFGLRMFSSLVEHLDHLDLDLSPDERNHLWDAYLGRLAAWLEHEGARWNAALAVWAAPESLPPELHWALRRHGLRLGRRLQAGTS